MYSQYSANGHMSAAGNILLFIGERSSVRSYGCLSASCKYCINSPPLVSKRYPVSASALRKSQFGFKHTDWQRGTRIDIAVGSLTSPECEHLQHLFSLAGTNWSLQELHGRPLGNCDIPSLVQNWLWSHTMYNMCNNKTKSKQKHIQKWQK